MVTLKDVAKAAGTSPATVSRVLNGVGTVDEEMAKRVLAASEQLNYQPNQAGRSLRTGMDSDYGPEFELRLQHNLETKRIIAKRAAAEIQATDIVILDSGSTVAQLVPYLPQGALMYTNSLALLQPMARRGLSIHLAPGLYVPEMAAVFGTETEEYFQKYKPSKYIFSSARVDVRTGLYNVSPFTLGVKKVVLRNATESILLVDHEKFCDAGLPGYAHLSSIDMLITDYVPAQFREAVKQTGVTLIELGMSEMGVG